MERDFMGLNSKAPVVVKEEFVEGRCEDSGFARSSGVPWLFPNKSPALPLKPELLDEKDPKKSVQQFLGRLPFAAAPVSVLPSAAGAAEQLINNMAVNTPSQLTIFYGGTVCVFDDITPDKAQAIILLAGKGLGLGAKPKIAAGDRVPISGHASPISVSSQPTDGANAPPPAPATDNEMEPPKKTPSASAMISAAVPQARKASLARFLEKRKERVMNAVPYTMNKKPAAAISGAGSSSGKEIADDA